VYLEEESQSGGRDGKVELQPPCRGASRGAFPREGHGERGGAFSWNAAYVQVRRGPRVELCHQLRQRLHHILGGLPNTKGSDTAYKPGQFTRICGNEGKPVDNLYFAGEHANSFHGWQGFMEGASLSCKDAAAAILQAAKVAQR